jgi:hypothetical protein
VLLLPPGEGEFGPQLSFHYFVKKENKIDKGGGGLSPRGDKKTLIWTNLWKRLDVHIFYLQYRMFFIYSIEWRTAIFVHSV